MQTFSLKARLCILLNGRRLVLVNRLMDRRLAFKDDFGEQVLFAEPEFYRLYEQKQLALDPEQPYIESVPLVTSAPPDLTCFPKKHSDEALRRRSYLNALFEPDGSMLPSDKELRTRIAAIACVIEDEKRPPSPPTVRRWARRYGKTRCVVRLVPQHCAKGRAVVIRDELETLLQAVLEVHYLKPERPTISQVYGEFKLRVDAANNERLPSQQIVLPSEMTLRRYIDRLDQYQLECKRLGKHAADRKHRNAIGRLDVEEILDRWEIDHTLLDILIVDPKTGEVIGRPYITVVLDRHSRMIMGFLIHLSTPNTESVLRTIERAIRPKQAWLASYPDVVNEWRACGLPRYCVPDNAAEFHAFGLVAAFNELGIELLFPRSRGPEMKGAVERFFRTMAEDLIHRLAGTTFSNPRERGDYPSEQLACITLADLNALVTKWIVDCYHQRPHRGLNGRAPAPVWLEGEVDRTPRLPVDLDELECILSNRVSPRLHHYGVEVDCQQYHSDELAELRLRLGHEASVDVRFRDELGHIWVRDPYRNLFFQVPNRDKRMTGKSRDLYKQARERVKEEKGDPNDNDAVLVAYHQIMVDAEEAQRSNKLRKRRTAAQVRLDKEGRERQPSIPATERKSTQANLAFEFDDSAPTFDIHPRSF
ncbi:integrase [Ralstonia solanacearum P673]|uniref:integrase n=1 Tax=Ralstonia solanacearum TaxID=305 RepID=UPI00202A49A9|nr:integrase [Ralstonia solanacearum]MCL9847592.1 integrase [Ralstonia solanacearum]MCL9853630.1 integrase [Ralstonia solanacearum]MCL9861476.1 integrase [Ralstonia solanacearum]MCL9863632.1 integrase [Ralstonia solanacearum]MCL9868076.1 integrase [Ralstonia solanacearum]